MQKRDDLLDLGRKYLIIVKWKRRLGYQGDCIARLNFDLKNGRKDCTSKLIASGGGPLSSPILPVVCPRDHFAERALALRRRHSDAERLLV